MVVFLLNFKPFITNTMNRVELFNEICILVVHYMVLAFEGMINDVDTIYLLGYTVILFTLFNLFANMLILFIILAKNIIGSIRKCRQRR